MVLLMSIFLLHSMTGASKTVILGVLFGGMGEVAVPIDLMQSQGYLIQILHNFPPDGFMVILLQFWNHFGQFATAENVIHS